MTVPRITENYEYCITFPRTFADDCTLQPFKEKAAEYTFFCGKYDIQRHAVT